MLRVSASGLAVVLLTVIQPSGGATGSDGGAEFPPQDQLVLMLQRRGVQARTAARLLKEAPGSPETVRLLARAENYPGLLHALRAIVDGHPRRIAEAFEALGDAIWRFRGDEESVRRNARMLQDIVADARKRLPDLPREEAARAERVFLSIDAEFDSDRSSTAWPRRLERFIQQYRGTEAALLAEVDHIGSGKISQDLFARLDAFVQQHPGTTAAARALYLKGFQWHTISTLGVLEPRGADPIARFERVREVVAELESGRYPRSESVEKAPSLLIDFFMPRDSTIATESVERMLAAYSAFVRSHFTLDPEYPSRNGIGYVIASKMGELFARKGERLAGIERVLSELERSVPDAAPVRYLRAQIYLDEVREQRGEKEALVGRAREMLAALSGEGQELYHRKALATLASLDFQNGEYTAARAAFQRYVRAYPQSAWTWVALLRIGQCDEFLGDPAAAAATYLEAATAHAGLPLARVLGYEYAARAHELAGEFEKALVEHRRALDGWDTMFGLRYATNVRRSPNPDDPFVPSTDISEVTKESLAPRIAQLERSLSLPGGIPLERGRALLVKGQHQQAAAEFERVLLEFPASPAAPEARMLAHRARLERALERAEADERAALQDLEALGREAVDFPVTAAGIARASILWKRGDAGTAEKVMAEALARWHAQQQLSAPGAGLEQDVAEIRRAVFLPRGGSIYGTSRWNAFSWPMAPQPFAIVNADVRVKDHAGDVSRVTLMQELPGAAGTKVLFFESDQIARVEAIIAKLGGMQRRAPRHVMETPNQPVGDSMQILKLWDAFFPARPGHWGGWEIETYPVITEIHFTNPERTKASAKVTIGYSGATVELVKENGTWIAKRLTGEWIT